MSEGSDSQSPVVLFFGFESSIAEAKASLGLDSRYVEKIAGGSIKYLSSVSRRPWWVDPTDRESMHELLFFVFGKKRTPTWVENWLKSDKFEKLVRRDIESSLGNGFQNGFNEQVRTRVKIVVIHISLYPDHSDYVRRVFDGLFPVADYYVWSGEEKELEPIWYQPVLVPIAELTPERGASLH